MMPNYSKRIWELDLLKGIALILMIYFHIVYDLDVIFQYEVDSSSLLNDLTAKASGSLFIFAAGVSSYLTHNNLKRAMKVLGIALLITVLTYLYDPGMVVTFGILHLLGTSILLALLFRHLQPFVLIILGAVVILGAPMLTELPLPHHWLLFPLGIAPETAISSDYYPLIPWFGVFLLGNGVGKWFYKEKRSFFRQTPSENLLSLAGRHTLVIYLIHQPLIIGVLSLIKIVTQ